MNKTPGLVRQAPVISPYTPALSTQARSAIKGQRPLCLWLTGLSGAGKSTLANALEVHLHHCGLHTFLLDGDNVREGLCRDLGMDDDSRRENIRRLSHVARLMVDAGLVVIVAAISPFRADRDAARRLFDLGDFIEVHVSTSLDVCARRDPKGLYKAVREGRIKNFTGIDSPYEVPLAAECRIDTDALDLGKACQLLAAFVVNK